MAEIYHIDYQTGTYNSLKMPLKFWGVLVSIGYFGEFGTFWLTPIFWAWGIHGHNGRGG